MKNVKLIALDMDGVVNSSVAIRKWFDAKFNELESKCYIGDEIRLAARKAYAEEFKNSTELVFPEHAKYITEICQKTDAYILWTSSWRLLDVYQDFEYTKKMFNQRNLPGDRLIGYTPQLHFKDAGIRGNNINAWLKSNDVFDYKDLMKCAVIDDRTDAGEMLPDKCKFFWIDPEYGITAEDTEKIIEYLNSSTF